MERHLYLHVLYTFLFSQKYKSSHSKLTCKKGQEIHFILVDLTLFFFLTLKDMEGGTWISRSFN